MTEFRAEPHPVQVKDPRCREAAQVPAVVALAAYEVYCRVYSSQEAMVTGSCRGGFSAGELIAFLYARSFPRDQWGARVDEAFRGMRSL